MSGRTLIIGISGFIGSHVAESLRGAGIQVVGLGPRWSRRIPCDAFFAGRSETTELLEDALEDCENVIYLGGSSRPAVGMARISDEIARESNHVIDLAEFCTARGVRRFVFASSGGTVYGIVDQGTVIDETSPTQPISAYGLAKLVVEHGLRLISRRTGLVTVSLRMANPFGPRQFVKAGQGFVAAACDAAVNGTPLKVWGDGTVVRDFVFVEDVAEAFVKALSVRAGAEILNIGTGEGHTLIDICRRIEALSQRSIDIRFERGRPVDAPSIVLSNRRAAEMLEWRPGVTLDDGLIRTIDWWRSTSQMSGR